MHIHILGICGTFMGSLAVLAKQLGLQVSGSDQHVYPPMSTQLQQQGIDLREGYDPSHLADSPDLVVIGNTCSRGNPAVEYVLEKGLPYCSGPHWLAEHVLKGRHVLAVAGTHGKTTTTAMLSWILEYAGLQPGFLIGGVPKNFDCSARLGAAPYFVIEADEYDSAFFDKRSKFIHYRPRTAILGNLEFDHADIFTDLRAIQTQFHHLLKIIPAGGLVLSPADDDNLREVLEMGLWCRHQTFGAGGDTSDWHGETTDDEDGAFTISHAGARAKVHWELLGRHNVLNGLAAVAAAADVGVDADTACRALAEFSGVKRRLELLGEFGGIRVYDDFAHHPTAIRSTLEGFRARLGREAAADARLVAVIEARSNTMKMGYHQHALPGAIASADRVIWYKSPASRLDLAAIAAGSATDFHTFSAVDDIVDFLARESRAGDRIVIMSNGGFEGLHERLCTALGKRAGS